MLEIFETRFNRHKKLTGPKVNTLADFENLWTPEPNSGCHLWLGRLDPGGYGRFYYHGKELRAHRAALMFAGRETPDDLEVRHVCDNPCCVNVVHLCLGTHSQNMEDMRVRGRSLRGESHPKAVLTEDDVQIIRGSSKGASALARDFGVGRATIYDIVYGKTWKHVPFPHGSSVRNADAPYPLASSDTAPVTVPPVTGAFSFSGSPMISTRLPVDADRVVKSALSGPQVYPAPEQIKGGGDVRHSTQFAAHRISSEVAHD